MENEWRSTLQRRGVAKHVVEDILDQIEDRWFESGHESLSPLEHEVFGLSCFVGEVANGGLLQFLLSDYGILLSRLPGAFEAAKVSELETMAKDILAYYPEEALRDEDSFYNWTENLYETHGPEFFQKLERPFWAFYPDRGDRDWFTEVIGSRLLTA